MRDIHRELLVPLLHHQGLHHLAANLGNLALQRAHAGLAREVAHDVANRALRDLEFILLEPVVLQLLGQQVALSDIDFLILGIT